ncbi:ZDHHC24 [Bugula neritina]|uniref:Palmitoyltransferase n=1 Tax=Bugula neritina TaxID=10212 RepID=A0A7J7KBG9_BUGNE|nr:ZDHHC24 [Bugula neritina]
MIMPTILKESWKFCYTCECNSPPRSWHCSACGRCILRRDHHCTFAGVCIGHQNYRYFIMLLFYLSVCGIYINVLNAEFVVDIMGGLSFQTLLAMLLPWAAWLMGIHGPFTFIVAFMSSLILFGTLLSAGYLLYQLNMIRQGRTSYEINKGQGKEYDIGTMANLKQIFGKNWKFCWLLPWLPSHLYTDGTRFLTVNSYEEIKDL